jgi:hypothetical protein
MSANLPEKSAGRFRRLLGTCAHTLLFAAYPVLAMLAYNIGEMPASAALGRNAFKSSQSVPACQTSQ